MFDLIPAAPLSLGKPTKGRRLRLNVKDNTRTEHMHVIGATNSGKSRFLLSLIQQDILEGRGLCLIDPHGELYDHIVAWLSNREGLFKDRKIRLINPSDLDFCFGFNPLHVNDPYSLPTVVDATATGLSHVMGGENIQSTPLLNETIRAICYALASANMTLVEAPYLYSCVHREEREAILSRLANQVAKTDWLSYQQYKPKDYDEFFRPAARRIRPFIQNDLMRRIFGQSKGTIDFKQAMDDGDILLFNLSRTGGKLTYEDQQTLGRLVLNNLVARAYERDPITARPFYLYVDEVQNFLSGDVPEILSSMRKFGLHLIMAHQYLEQLRNAGDLVFHGVMGTANNKVVFKLSYPDDAAIMAERVFAGAYNFKNPKDHRPVVVGHKVRQLRSRSVQDSTTDTASTTKTNVTTYSTASATSNAEGSGGSDGGGEGASMVLPDAGTADADAMRVINSTSSFSGSNWSVISGSSYANGESVSAGLNTSTSEASTGGKARTYAQALEPIIKFMPGTYFSLEEQKQVFQDALIKLQNRHAFAVISDEAKSIPFVTHTVNDEIHSPTFLKNLIRDQYKNSPCHEKTPTVEKEISDRQGSLMPKLLEEPTKDDFLE